LPPAAAPFVLVPEEDRARLPEDVEDAYPLSMLQAGLVYHSRASAEYAVYVTSHCVKGRVDLPALQHVVPDAGARHPMLRTSFDLTSFSQPLQLVHRAARLPIEVVDWTALPEGEQESALAGWIAEQRVRRFAWEAAPLFRIFVHERSVDRFQLTLVEPLLDGWSVALLCSEVLDGYAEALRGTYVPREPLQSRYRDYVALEGEALRSGAHRRFWSKLLQESERCLVPRWPLSA